MKTSFYFPAPVEVVKVTNENLAEVAEWCGGKVASTESRRVPGRQDSYVWVPTPKGNSISWAFPGMYITKRLVVTVKDEMKATYAVFRRDYFSRNYFDTPTEATEKTWEKQAKVTKPVAAAPVPKAPKPRETYKSKAEILSDNSSHKGIEITSEAEAIVDKLIEDEAAQLDNSSTEHLTKQQIMVMGSQVRKFRHNHAEAEDCGANDCTQDRAIEGIHIFADVRINTIQMAQATPTQKENDMPEINENGVPVLNEEEAADRAAEKELTMDEAVANVKEVIPGSEVIETTDLVGSDIEAGQPVTDAQIDAIHGEGAAKALDSAYADGSIFSDSSKDTEPGPPQTVGTDEPSSNGFNAGNLDD